MITSLYFATFLLLLSRCDGFLFGLFGGSEEFDIDKFNYKGDPIKVSCVYDESQTGFYQVDLWGSSKIPSALVDRLHNGKTVSLYFDGIASHIKPNSSTFKFAKEWFKTAESNICYITYAYNTLPIGLVTTFLTARHMVENHRLQFTAKMSRELVLSVRQKCLQNEIDGCLKNMSQVTMLGFSFGAHIASQACRDLYNKTGEKVAKLIGLDPAGIAITLKRFNQAFIESGDADYVQIIHTDVKAGTILNTGDVDIVVDASPVGFFNKHGFAVYMHMATALRKILLIAEEDGIGRVIPTTSDFIQEEVIKSNEVLIGIYGDIDASKRGKQYNINFHDLRAEWLRRSIAHVIKAKM